jgi:PAS domain S-box-containing protein
MPEANEIQTERRHIPDRRVNLCSLLVRDAYDHAVIFFDAQAKIIGWNGAAERAFGYPTLEVLGKHGDLIFTPEDRAMGVPEKELGWARETGHADDDRWHLRKDGSRFWANGAVCALRGTDGQLLGYGKIVRDRTSLRSALDNLAESRQRLLQSNQELERFASIISHDLQGPLHTISRLVTNLSDQHSKQLGLEALDSIGEIRETTQRMEAMVKGLLNYSRLGRLDLEREPVALNKVLEHVLLDLKEQIQTQPVELRIGVLPEVWADEVFLYQLFLNLIGNALKHGQVTPLVIEIEADETQAEWHIRVQDNGVGIPEVDQMRIFGFFERGAGQAQMPGLGIGLATSKRIVERHGGRLWVESRGRGGTTFHFTLAKPSSLPMRR